MTRRASGATRGGRDVRQLGEAVEIFQGGDFNTPHPAIGGPTEDACIAVKLVSITDNDGVVGIDVRKSDVLRFHSARN